MPTIVVADIPVEEFALRESLQAVPNLAVESQRVVEKDEDLVMPLMWVRGANGETVQTTLADDSSVSSNRRLTSSEPSRRWRRGPT